MNSLHLRAVRLLVTAHDIFITTLVLQLVDICAAQDLDKGILGARSDQLGHINAFLSAHDQRLQLGRELLIEVHV